MAAKRPGMMIYFEDWESASELLTPEQFKRLFVAVMHTAMGVAAESLDDDKALALVYHLVCDKVERDGRKYEDVCRKRQEAARRGAAARWQNAQNDDLEIKQNAKLCQTMPNDAKRWQKCPTVNVTENVNVTETGTVTHTPPTPSQGEETVCVKCPRWEEVVEYARAAGYGDVDETLARRYIGAQAARGWMGTDGQPIRDWRSWFDSWYNRNIRAISKPQSLSDKVAAVEALKQQFMREEE